MKLQLCKYLGSKEHLGKICVICRVIHHVYSYLFILLFILLIICLFILLFIYFMFHSKMESLSQISESRKLWHGDTVTNNFERN
jgi:hypothetical protein